MTTSIRVSDQVRQRAADLASEVGVSVGDLIERALDAYETAEFWRRTREALVHSSTATEDGWDRTLKDGLRE